MPAVLRHTLLSIRDLMVTAGPFILLALALLVAAYIFLNPNPPKRVVLATGPEQSDYAEFGERYREELKRFGIEVVLMPSSGSSANRRLLLDPKQKVDLAFITGGSGERIAADDRKAQDIDLVSLGSLFYEPVWLFYREEAASRLPGKTLTRLNQLKGWRVNLGARGSGAPNLMRRLLAATDTEREELTVVRLEQTPAVVEFLEGRLDAIVMVAAPESQMVQMLLRTPKVRLFEFEQGEAYARRFGFLNTVTLPQGIAELAKEIPPRDVELVASTAMLVARDDTHPAIIQLFVQAAHKIHSGPGWFARAGQFPSGKDTELPLDGEAERYYKKGPPLLQAYMPFWLANLIDRMWVALISIIAILIPLSRVVPPLYEFRIRSRIFRWYRNLRRIEIRLHEGGAPASELLAELDELDAKAGDIAVPLSYADELYNLRSHIELVRAKLRQREAVRDAAQTGARPPAGAMV